MAADVDNNLWRWGNTEHTDNILMACGHDGLLGSSFMGAGNGARFKNYFIDYKSQDLLIMSAAPAPKEVDKEASQSLDRMSGSQLRSILKQRDTLE